MNPTLIETTLQRLRTCQTYGKEPPPELVSDAIECLTRICSQRVARERRDRCIRQAATLAQAATLGDLASLLAREAAALSRSWAQLVHQPPPQPPFNVRDALHAARLQWPLPESPRQFRRILESGQDPYIDD